MSLTRVLRPFIAAPAPLLTLSTRLILPIRTHISTPISTRCLSTKTDSPSEQSTSPLPEPIESSTTQSQTESQPDSQPDSQPESKPRVHLPYCVNRNKLNNLGVYQKTTRGGNLKITQLKGAEGDLKMLKNDLKEALQIPAGDIAINSTTKHVMIRGYKKMQVLNFLHTMGF
ncbi:mitochondrial large subunit ribosomal protein-domain-containing protein [Hypomontagnella submonticulosa]|nr:mitochondrial large subunit ribosomal protein-domain-containing protein [Hypomontagnella submonticulosa]